MPRGVSILSQLKRQPYQPRMERNKDKSYPRFPCEVSRDSNDACVNQKLKEAQSEPIFHSQYYGERKENSYLPGTVANAAEDPCQNSENSR